MPSLAEYLSALSTFLLYINLANSESKGFEFVTCGSVIKLINSKHNVRLHSHEIKYGSGSGQQSVTAVSDADDVNSYWSVKGKKDATCKRGSPIKCGSTLQLNHVATKRNLHSHLFQSPISYNQEVSAFGEEGVGDDGDNWAVICSGKFWRRNENVRFKHVLTKKYLHITGDTFGRPIHGQREVSGFPSMDAGNEWKAGEGIYVRDETAS